MSDPVLPRSSEGIERGLLDYVQHKPECAALDVECRHCRMPNNRAWHGEYWHACKFTPKECSCGLAALLAHYTQGEK